MLALWNNLIAMQLVTKIAIPICVLLFVHPQETILYIIFLSMVPVSLTLIVAYVMYHCQQQRRRRICCSAKCFGLQFVQLIVIVAILVLIMGLIVLYEGMLLVQVQIGSGVKGLFFPCFHLFHCLHLDGI